MTEGMPDLTGLLAQAQQIQAQQMQAQLAATQEQLAGLSIASEATDPGDAETLADLGLSGV